jgi:predicted lipid-binding transport protein (Tim44 family)
MKNTLAVCAVVLSLGLTAALDAEAARRLGGGKSSGMQRQTTSQPAQQPGTPAQSPGATTQAPATANAPAAAAAPAAATAAATQKRSWMGPVAGLAAGLGIAALASHFGFGEALANMLTIALMVMAVLLLVGFIMRKRAAGQGQQPAWAGAGGMNRAPQDVAAGGLGQQTLRTSQEDAPATPARGSLIGSRIGSGLAGGTTAAAAGTGTIPADFDVASFVRGAKSNFTDLQAANDAGDLVRLRQYLTPEMYEVVREDIATRGSEPQKTEVFGLEAQVLDVAQESGQYVVSVRFTGSIRHAHGEAIEDLNEVWHLAKPVSGGAGWVVAGIQQA